MVKVILLFLLMTTSFAGYSQKTDTIIHNGTTNNKNTIVLDDRPHKTDPAYFIDGISVPDLTGIYPARIFCFNILKGVMDTERYGPKAKDGVILITTILCAREQIQQKLGAFSRPIIKYNAFRHAEKVTYILNNSVATEREVYDLPKEKIKKVKFIASEINPVVKIESDKFSYVSPPPLQIYIKGNN